VSSPATFSRLASDAAQLGPELCTAVPGPASRGLAKRLAAVESRNVTCVTPDAPIFWQRARGVNVWDVDGNRFVDLSGAFGVANAGHAHPRVTRAIAEQSRELLHGMGDVHPSAVKVELLEALVRRFPGGGEARVVLGSSGSDAVEAALKTALLATGKPGVVAFESAYHGLSLGALDVTERAAFRTPFAERLPRASVFARFGDAGSVVRAAEDLEARGSAVGCVLVEPVQGRGGERVPPRGFLSELRALCDDRGWLLAVDEVYTGFGRTGRWFACEHEAVVPDLLCVGKGLSSGMPLSALVGRAEVVDAWPISNGEALHTQTFLGHPASCAAGLASLAVIEEEGLVEHAARAGAAALAHAESTLASMAAVREVRGMGLMIGIECATADRALDACRRALEAGWILLPSGDDSRVLSITPPLCIDEALLLHGIDVLAECLA
jgi:4-aminobutyrate aminotransferase/(S)-3-amino-2-methylpropionate transaminase